MASRRRRAPRPARLAELGFVRDYPGMAYYAGWATRRMVDMDVEPDVHRPHHDRRRGDAPEP